jgi:hypothetical protein
MRWRSTTTRGSARGWVLSPQIIAILYYRDRHPEAIPEGQAFVADRLTDFVAR